MSIATEKPKKSLDSKQRTWLQKMGAALGVSVKSEGGDDKPSLTDDFTEVMWGLKKQAFDAADSNVKEMEEAQVSKAQLFRKGLTLIQGLANKKKFAEAEKAFGDLEPKINAEYEKFFKARCGVRDLGGDESDKKSDKQPKYEMGVEIPESHKDSAKQERYATGLDIPEPRPDKGAQGAAAPAKGPGGFISASVGKGGKNLPEDVKTVQAALNKYGDAKLKVDGKYSAQTQKAIEEFQKKLGQFKPDGLIQPNRGTARCLSGAAKIPPTPPAPKPIAPPDLGKATLDKGAFVWHSTRGILDTNIKELKKGVRGAYGTEHPDLLKEIDNCMLKLGTVVDKLDTRLADALDSAYKAPSDKARVPELKKAEGIMKEYLKYVKAEPLIGHMDDNPFGVKTSLMKVITDALKHLSQLLPQATPEKKS